MEPLSASFKSALEEATSRYQANLDSAQEYLTGRGISPDTAMAFRLGVVSAPITGHEQYAGRLAIPYLGLDASVYGLRFRAMNGEEPKYTQLAGIPTRMFNVRAIHRPGDTLHVTEGELDALILEQAGFSAVGVPGATNWKRHHSRLVAGFTKVFIWGDGDKAGAQFARTVNESMNNGVVVNLAPGMDVNDLYLSEGVEGLHKALGLEEA
jgi:DNA primase